MTVREYARYEEAKDARYLFRYLRFLSHFSLFTDDIQAFIDEFNSLFNADADDMLMNSVEQLSAYNQLIIMEALLEAVKVHTFNRAELNLIRTKIGAKVEQDEMLIRYIEMIKQETGFTIETLEDIKAYAAEVERKRDKYNEKYTNKPKKEGMKILDLFGAVCKVMETAYDYKTMTLWEFAQFKRQAEEHTKRLEARLNKTDNG